jgi:hypothetical protein
MPDQLAPTSPDPAPSGSTQPASPTDPQYQGTPSFPTPAHPLPKHLPKWIALLLVTIFIGAFILGASNVLIHNNVAPTPSLIPTVSVPTQPIDPRADWKTFNDPTFNFTLKYPRDAFFYAVDEDTLVFSLYEDRNGADPTSVIRKRLQVLELGGTSINEATTSGDPSMVRENVAFSNVIGYHFPEHIFDYTLASSYDDKKILRMYFMPENTMQESEKQKRTAIYQEMLSTLQLTTNSNQPKRMVDVLFIGNECPQKSCSSNINIFTDGSLYVDGVKKNQLPQERLTALQTTIAETNFKTLRTKFSGDRSQPCRSIMSNQESYFTFHLPDRYVETLESCEIAGNRNDLLIRSVEEIITAYPSE